MAFFVCFVSPFSCCFVVVVVVFITVGVVCCVVVVFTSFVCLELVLER